MVAHAYLVFEHADSGNTLVLDPTINATLSRVTPDIIGFAELKYQIRSALEQQHKYSTMGKNRRHNQESVCTFPGAGEFMPHDSYLVINSYIYDSDSSSGCTLEDVTDCLFNTMYSANTNPVITYDECKPSHHPVAQHKVTSYQCMRQLP
ncbi:hypothetical protein GCM10023116_24990 [Kistimonas scapharcae]|uniref:Uncharacterized protein n=1 Tax=Kistimonas scapharcae TaxID=1036133 RepID=A0ABP8V2P9_9GAMM